MIYYSKSIHGFFDCALSDAQLPSDAVELTAEEYQSLKAAESAGQVISADSNGRPIAIAPVASWTDVQTKAKQILRDNDDVATRCVKAGVAYPAEWRTYDGALRVIVRTTNGDPTQPLPTAPAYPAGT